MRLARHHLSSEVQDSLPLEESADREEHVSAAERDRASACKSKSKSCCSGRQQEQVSGKSYQVHVRANCWIIRLTHSST